MKMMLISPKRLREMIKCTWQTWKQLIFYCLINANRKIDLFSNMFSKPKMTIFNSKHLQLYSKMFYIFASLLTSTTHNIH